MHHLPVFVLLLLTGCAYTEERYLADMADILCDKIDACDEEEFEDCRAAYDLELPELECPEGVVFDSAAAHACKVAFDKYELPNCEALSIPEECYDVCFPDFG